MEWVVVAVLFILQHGLGRCRTEKGFLDECGCSVIERLSTAGMSVCLKHRQICFTLWLWRGWTSHVPPLRPRAALLQICTEVCVNPASSLHPSRDNYELLQARLFVSNSLILWIIIDHRCLAGVFLKFSPSSLFSPVFFFALAVNRGHLPSKPPLESFPFS